MTTLQVAVRFCYFSFLSMSLAQIATNNYSFPFADSSKELIFNEEQPTAVGIDLLILADHSVYETFLNSVGNDQHSAQSAIHQYFSTILKEVDRIYSSIRMKSFKFSVNSAGIIWAKEAKDSPWVSARHIFDSKKEKFSLDALEVLKKLKKWTTEHRNAIPEHDHAVAVTKKDLSYFDDDMTQGIAYVKSICKRGESVSVAEDLGAMATVAVIAHELAHSLGAEHDGNTSSANCSEYLNYLMVPSVSSNQKTLGNSFAFSPCTLEQIEAHLKQNEEDTRCLHKSPAPISAFGHETRRSELFGIPGQLYDADQQCQLAFGKHHRYCDQEDFYLSQLCQKLWCRNTKESRYSPCSTRHYLPALYGTSCGHKMWCVKGACVENQRAPPQAGCKFGDRNSSFCIKMIKKRPKMCRISTFERFCCRTCKNLKHYRRINTWPPSS